MTSTRVKIEDLSKLQENPRDIKKDKLDKLIQSIKEFPEMTMLRPLIVDEDLQILGGNMRFEAMKALEFTEVEVVIAKGLSEDQKREFIIKDNLNYGQWDWDKLANEWDNNLLSEWGMDVWIPEPEYDLGDLEDGDLDDKIKDLEGQTKKSIILEFPTEDFEPVKAVYDQLKNEGTDLPELFYEAMLQKTQES